MIPGDLLSAFPHRQFHTLPSLLDSWAALPNSYPNAYMPMQGGSLYHFYDGLWYDPAEKRTHDLPCERRTRYRLSQPDTVAFVRSMYGAIQLNPFCEATLTRGHSLWKGHSTMSTPDERPLPLERPLDNVYPWWEATPSGKATRQCLPLMRGHSLLKVHFSCAKGVASLEGFNCNILLTPCQK